MTRRRAFRTTLNDLRVHHPTLENHLREAEQNRCERLQRYMEGVRLRGYEELLDHLDEMEKAFSQHHRLRSVAFLLRRARGDFVTALEATLSGYHIVVHDAMRDVMEIEFLFRDFRYHTPHIEEWLNCDHATRRRRFSSGALRKRFADRLGIRPADLADTNDYNAHSSFLHVNPFFNPFAGVPGVTEPPEPFAADSCFWEIFEHARRLVFAIHGMRRRRAPRLRTPAGPEKGLEALRDAWASTQQTMTIFRTFRRAMLAEAEPGAGAAAV